MLRTSIKAIGLISAAVSVFGCASGNTLNQAATTVEDTILYKAPRLVMSLTPESSSDGLTKYNLQLFKGLLCNKADVNYEYGSVFYDHFSLCNSQLVPHGEITFRCYEGSQSTWKINLSDKEGLSSIFMGFIYENCRPSEYSGSDNRGKIFIKAKYKGSAITDEEREIAKNWTWDFSDVFLLKANDTIYKAGELIEFPQDEKNKASYIAAYNSYRKPIEERNTKLEEERYKKDGFPLMDVFNDCYQEQMDSLKVGKDLGKEWFPTKLRYNSGVNYYKIVSAVGQNPIRLVLEGPGDLSDNVQSKCLIVVSVENKSFLGAPNPLVGESIGGFKVKSKGKISLLFKPLRALSPIKLTLPEFELITPISQVIE